MDGGKAEYAEKNHRIVLARLGVGRLFGLARIALKVPPMEAQVPGIAITGEAGWAATWSEVARLRSAGPAINATAGKACMPLAGHGSARHSAATPRHIASRANHSTRKSSIARNAAGMCWREV